MTTTQTTPTPDLIGAPIADLDTPCLLLNWPVTERNLKTMHGYFADRHAKLRPHFKNHKCTTLARKQVEAGNTVGMTAAKVGEAEVLADAGFDDILIANQVMGRRKVARLVEVARKTRIAVAVDHIKQATDISDAADAAGVTVGLLVEVDGGMGRCGVAPAPGSDALDLAKKIIKLPGVTFGGIQCFEGQVIYINDDDERGKLTRETIQKAVDTRRLIEKAGIEVPVISGGSSATYQFTGNMDGVDEIQAGTYATMDWRYHEVVPQFDVALTLLNTVISVRDGNAVLDSGVKGAGGEFGVPKILGAPDVEVPYFLSEEHLVVRNTTDWQVGQTVQVVPSHACTTCNLHRRLFVHDGEKVIDVWPIDGSGKLA